jgi:hypothetical protein
VLNSGPNVVLSWTPPAIGFPISYVIEASSQPGGPPDRANFNTGNSSTSLFVPNVPGWYLLRADPCARVSATWSRPTVGGDSPQHPGDSVGTLSCTVALTYR